MMHAPSQPEHYEDEEFINLSINLSSSGTNRLSVNLFSTNPEDTVWPALVEQFIKALNAYGFIIKGTNQLVIDSYGSVTRTKINGGHTDE
jgi:hypothetical protein